MNPDAAKIRAYLARLKAVPVPELETVEGSEILRMCRAALDETVEGTVELIQRWEAETPR
jgi:hypothetical protein